MADAHVIAVAAFAADELDGAVARGEDRRAGRSRPVDAGMHAQHAEQRMPALAEAIDPAQLAAQLNEHRRAMNDVIMKRAGIVMQYVGDAVFAVFGPATSPQSAR